MSIGGKQKKYTKRSHNCQAILYFTQKQRKAKYIDRNYPPIQFQILIWR